VVYECLEEAAGFTRSPRKQRYVREMDAQLCRRADVVFVPNAQMHATRKAISRRIEILPWPVDADHYGQARDGDLAVPADLRNIPNPVIGFYGNLDTCRFDVELIQGLAQRRPDWQFVLVGRLWPGFDPAGLRRLPNVHLLGEKRLADLPAYIRGFDVGIIPYRLNDFTRSITPLKLMEYLATGKPVVSSPLPAALPYADVLGIADGVDEFEAQIVAALDEPAGRWEERQRVARRHDWASCMRRKADIVTAILRDPAAPLPPTEADPILSCHVC
jgi:glycosyltransferase involved in cell wall biosynthesis